MITWIEEKLKVKIAAVEPFSIADLSDRADLIRDADTLLAVHKRIMAEFSYLVEASIIEGLAGHVEQSVLYHKLSFQCLQINGMLMEHARNEGPNEYYMTARKAKAAGKQ